MKVHASSLTQWLISTRVMTSWKSRSYLSIFRRRRSATMKHAPAAPRSKQAHTPKKIAAPVLAIVASFFEDVAVPLRCWQASPLRNGLHLQLTAKPSSETTHSPLPEHSPKELESSSATPVGPVWKSKFYGAFVLNHRVVLHAIDATPARWRGDAGSSPLDRARTCTRHTG